MAGALNALKIGSVMTDRNGCIVACCSQFASFLERPESELMGRFGRDFMRADDAPFAARFLETLWRTGASFTLTASLVKANGTSALYESHVSRLTGPLGAVALSVVRPFNCAIWSTEPDTRIAASKASYVVDLSGQLADFAADAFMPVTSDLLRVAAQTAAYEAG